ncbi:MAG: tetratricopeptide repeat protein [Thermoanaerobaculia bacterium]
MFLIPIGRDDAVIRRHAWVSYTIMALCIAAYIAFNLAVAGAIERRLEAKLDDALAYLVEHPYLEIPPDVDRFLPPRIKENFEQIRRGMPPQNALKVEREQRALDALARDIAKAVKKHPIFRLGFTPKDPSFLTLITSMFLHGGLMHLLGNLLFFFVTGPFLEDVFGRPAFAGLYLSGGIVATMAHYAADTSSGAPLVGASGAIAAVMGANLFRFYRSKFEFLFIPLWFRPQIHFRFFLPALLVLPFWFVMQLAMAAASKGEGGVAFWAHVGGFGYGFVFALVFALLGIESKYVNPVVEKATTWEQSGELIAAAEARSEGKVDVAAATLDAMLKREPGNVDARRMAYDVELERGNARAAGVHAARLLDVYLRKLEGDLARALIDEAVTDCGDALGEAFFRRAAAYLDRSGERERAIRMYRHLASVGPDGEPKVRSMMRMAVLLRGVGDLREARSILEDVRRHPACTDEWKRAAAQHLAAVDAAIRAQQS